MPLATKAPHRWNLLFTLAILITASPVSAGESRWYVESKVGQIQVDTDLGESLLGWRLDDEDTSASVEVGYTINDHLSVQAGYRDLGSYPGLPPVCEVCTLDFVALEVEVSGISLVAVPRWPINERFSLYGKVGVLDWDADASVQFTGDRAEILSDEDLLAAVGAQYGFPSGFGVLLEYEVTDLFEGASLGASWRF